MIKIRLDEIYWLLSDERQWILAKQMRSGRLIHKYFYGNLSNLLQSYATLCLRTSDCKSITKLIETQKQLETRLCKLLQPLEFELQLQNKKS